MATPTASDNAESRTRPATIVLTIVAAATIIALVAGALIAGRSATYPPGSPEAAAQSYLQALLDRDEHVAHRVLAPELAAACEPMAIPYRYRSAETVQIVNSATTADHAAFDLEFSYSGAYQPFDDPFEDSWHSPRSAQIELELREGAWRIVDATWIPNHCRER